jgi:hypothetical protein
VSENKWLFAIVKDQGFQNLMKTGCPEYHFPSPETVSHDIKVVFLCERKHIADMLQVSYFRCQRSINLLICNGSQMHKGVLNFATNAWTSPNHKAYVAISIHFENNGVPITMLLDIIEVACSHFGLNLAAAFAKILQDFSISDKV